MIVALHDHARRDEHDNRVPSWCSQARIADFFLAHYDIAADIRVQRVCHGARTPFHHWANLLIRSAGRGGDDQRHSGAGLSVRQ